MGVLLDGPLPFEEAINAIATIAAIADPQVAFLRTSLPWNLSSLRCQIVCVTGKKIQARNLVNLVVYHYGNNRGILVKLVIRISSGHPKIKIISFVKYATFAWFLLCNNVLWLKNWFGNLIPHLANILWPVFGNSLSRGDTRKKYTAHLARKSILSAQIKCKRHHLMLKSMSRSIYVLFFHFHLVHVQWLLSPRDNVQKSPFSFQIFISNWN